MFELNYIHVSLAVLTIAFCLYFKVIPFGMNVSADDPPKTDDPPKDDKVSKEEYIKLQQKIDALESEKKENERKSNESKGKYKELYESEKAKVTELEGFKTKFEDFEKKQREKLVAELPDEHKDLAKDFDLDKLEKYVELNKKKDAEVDTDESKSGKGIKVTVNENSKLSDFNKKELEQIQKDNPKAFAKLLAGMK